MPFVDREDKRIFYEEIDLTPPWIVNPQTIMLHHGIGTTSGVWSDWLPVLSGMYRLLRLDMRGFGQSSTAEKAGEWSLDLLADDAIAVADHAGCSRFHFVGESIGGTLGLFLAIRHPQRLQTLTVSNGAHRGVEIQNVQQWGTLIEQQGQEAWSRQLMDWRFYPGALSDAHYQWFHRQQSTSSLSATLDLAKLLLQIDLSAEVSKIELPVLLLSPDNSPFIPVSVMVDLFARLGNAVLQVFPHTRHGLPYSNGAECAAVLKKFLDRRAVA